uniref:Putative secreted protein n=1 Tax=Anopheles marajoara TaxID=58244 RepID=A0A2M4C9F7_9DIPT
MFISLIFELPRSCLPPLHTTVTFFWLVLMLCCRCSGVDTSRVLLPFVVVVAEPGLDVSIFAAASVFALSVCSSRDELVGTDSAALCTSALVCGK